jgi:hypothetical protein
MRRLEGWRTGNGPIRQHHGVPALGRCVLRGDQHWSPFDPLCSRDVPARLIDGRVVAVVWPPWRMRWVDSAKERALDPH